MDHFTEFQLLKTFAPEGCIGVGALVSSDGQRYALVYRGRDAHLYDGQALSAVLDRAWINPHISASVAEAGRSIWGSAWPDELALITGIDRRRLSGTRLEQSGLPPKVLVGLASLIESPDLSRAIGSLVVGAAHLSDADVELEQWPLMLERARRILVMMSD